MGCIHRLGQLQGTAGGTITVSVFQGTEGGVCNYTLIGVAVGYSGW